MPGPTPKPPSKRRHTSPPKSWGAATPITASAAATQPRDLGFDPPVHPLVESMWATLAESAEARFFSAADWERVRFELFFANTWLILGTPIPGAVWAVVQHGLSALLISPAEKRRCGIELKPPAADADEDAAVLQIAKYQDKLKSD
jgi:hypothetical protein